MRTDFAILCDTGHVRDGLAYVIGGGIDRFYADELPIPLQASVVARVLVDPEDVGPDHELRVRLVQEEGDRTVSTIQGTFPIPPPGKDMWQPGFATALRLDGIQLPAYGFYVLHLEVDEVQLKTFRFQVARPPALPANRQARRATNPPRKSRQRR
jgi:hypothetical protein